VALCCSLELGIDVPVHFYDFGARDPIDKVVSDDVRLREVVSRVPDLAQEFIESVMHALRGRRVFQDVAAGLLPVNPEEMIASPMSLVLLARGVRNFDRALRRPIPFVLFFERERSPHGTGVFAAKREPDLGDRRIFGVWVVPLVATEVGRVELLVKDQKEFSAELMDFQVGQVPGGTPVDDARELHLVGARIRLRPELLQGIGHVPGAFCMADPENEELRRVNKEKGSCILQGRHQRAPVLAKGPIPLLLEKVAHRWRFLLLDDPRGPQEAADVKNARTNHGLLIEVRILATSASTRVDVGGEVTIDAGIVAPRETQFNQLPVAFEAAHPIVNRHFLTPGGRCRHSQGAFARYLKRRAAPLLSRHPKTTGGIIDNGYGADKRIFAISLCPSAPYPRFGPDSSSTLAVTVLRTTRILRHAWDRPLPKRWSDSMFS
jgi:hypothetical protein